MFMRDDVVARRRQVFFPPNLPSARLLKERAWVLFHKTTDSHRSLAAEILHLVDSPRGTICTISTLVQRSIP